jgi:nucleotide-binding universal stress UspA family protein
MTQRFVRSTDATCDGPREHPSIDKEAGVDREPILICYDGSDESVRAIHAASIALAGRRAVVVDIGPVLTGAESYEAISPGVDVALLEQLNLESAHERASEGAKVARRAGFFAQPDAALSAPTWQGIIDLADEIDAALIVVGSRGLKGAREVFEGSVSHEVAKHARCPVLVVPQQAAN